MPRPGRRWLGLALIAAAQFVVIMDTSIIGVALPDIQAELGFTPESLSWVFNAYVVAFGGLLLLGGRLSDVFGARKIFIAGWLILIARLACSPEPPSNVGARDRRPRGPRRGRRAHRPGRTDPADDAVRRHRRPAARRSRSTAPPHRSAAPPASSSAACSPSTRAGRGCSTSPSRSRVLVLAFTPSALPARPRPAAAPSTSPARSPRPSGLAAIVYGVVRAPEVGWASRRDARSPSPPASLLLVAFFVDPGAQPRRRCSASASSAPRSSARRTSPSSCSAPPGCRCGSS